MESVRALLDHIGLGHNDSDTETLSELMNFTLQCLGAVRVMVTQKEKERLAAVAAQEWEPASTDEAKMKAVRDTFSVAVNRILSSVETAKELDDLDPARHLVESFPDAKRFDHNRWLQIHWALIGENVRENTESGKQRVSAAKQLANLFPDSVGDFDKEGRSIGHYAARLSLPDLVDFVGKFSESESEYGHGATGFLSVTNSNGALPLHNAARFCGSVEVAEKILGLYPDAIQVPNNDGSLPIHWAAAKNKNIQLVELLLEKFPEAIAQQTKEGYLPLHSAAQNRELSVVRLILNRFPDAIRSQEAEGGYPLHHACYFNSSVEVLKLMYEAFPAAISSPQTDGITPLHLAAGHNSSPEIMQYILSVHPSAPTAIDSAGWTPLHCLVDNKPIDMNKGRVDCLHLLIKAYPEAVVTVNQSGASPISLAISKGHSKFVLRYLLSAGRSFQLEEKMKRMLADLNWDARKWALFACLSSKDLDAETALELPAWAKLLLRLSAGLSSDSKFSGNVFHNTLVFL